MNSMEVASSKRITLQEFISYITKNKECLAILNYYSILIKDDLRLNFGHNEELPDCDSDLENEVKEKQYELNTTIANRKETEEPDASLELEFIYGYRCEDVRNNIRYTRKGNIVYHTASIGVVLNVTKTKQKHFKEHGAVISCLAIHPELVYAATSEISLEPFICIWDTSTLECLARISGVLKKGVTHLAFSGDGKYIAAIGADSYHSLAIYNWKTNTLVGCTQVSRSPVLSLTFNPSNTVIATTGIKSLNFITIKNGLLKVNKTISWGASLPKTLLCGAYLDNAFVTGSFSGELLVWKEEALASTYLAHKGLVNAIWVRDNKKGLITGGNDGIVILWDTLLRKESIINIVDNKVLNCLLPKIRSVCESLDGSVVIGVRSGEIIEYREGKFDLLRSHFKNKLYGLAVHPKLPEFVTFGQDGIFAHWDIPSRKQKQV